MFLAILKLALDARCGTGGAFPALSWFRKSLQRQLLLGGRGQPRFRWRITVRIPLSPIDLSVNGRTVVSESGSGLSSNAIKEHHLKWKAEQPGRWQVTATLTFSKPLPGASRTVCRKCMTKVHCNFPYFCNNGVSNQVCSYQAVADNPNNNVTSTNLEVRGGSNLPITPSALP